MRRSRLFLIILGNLALILLTFSTAQADTLTPARPHPARVIVISLDGARPDAILQAETPNIQALAERGAVSWQASTVFPPVTIPAHTSMLTGLDTSEHGVTWNDYRDEPITTPTFLTLAAEAGYSTAMVVGKEKFSQFRQTDVMDYVFARVGDRSVVDEAINLIEGGVEVLFVHFPNPDYFGHSRGWMSDVYLNEFYNTDLQVGRLLTALDETGTAAETLIILTADHGGHDLVHGSDIPEDMTIPFILAGGGVISGMVLENDVHVTDAAMTVLWTLGLQLPETALGRPLREAFNRE